MEENMVTFKTVALTIGSIYGYASIAAGVIMTILLLQAVFTK
jgi:hypothetical protein